MSEDVTSADTAEGLSARGGFLIVFDEARRTDLLRGASDFEKEFSDALSADDWRLKQWEVCGLLFERGVITHWALARRGKKVATSKVRVQFSQIVRTNIAVADVERLLGGQLRGHLTSVTSGLGGRVAKSTWEGIKAAVRTIDPESFAALERLEALRDQSHQKITQQGFEIVAGQRDAVGLALDAFDPSHELRRHTLKGWAPPQAPALSSFLDGLAGIHTIEDQLIARDVRVFPGANAARATVAGSVFGVAGQKLEVFNVNRTAIERSLGVDLLYWNETFDAWTMIQYKVMQRGKGKSKEVAYWPDDAFDEAMTRMDAFRKRLPDVWETPQTAQHYRLCGDGFYFKFCTRVQLEVLSDSLLPGRYFPRLFLLAALDDRSPGGVLRGRVITEGRPERHINNTLFADLLRDGWIGTRGISSSEIAAITREAFVGDRALVIARARPVHDRANLVETLRDLGIRGN